MILMTALHVHRRAGPFFCEEFEVEMAKNVLGYFRQWENAFFYGVIVR